MDLFPSSASNALTPGAVTALALMFSISALGLIANVFVLRCFRQRPPDDPDLGASLRATPWRWSEGLSCVVVMLASILLGRMELQLFGLGLVLYTLRVTGSNGARAFGLRVARFPGDVARGAGAYLAAFPIVAFYWLIFTGVLQSLGVETPPQPIVQWLIDPATPVWQRTYIIVYAVTIAPFIEELFFRGVLLPGLIKHMRPSVAVFVVSAVFALMHLHLPTFVPLFMIGWAFSLAYLYTGSLLVPVVMHILFNGVNVVLMILLRDMPQVL